MWGGVLDKHLDGANSVSQVMESQIWSRPAGCVALCGEGSKKQQWPLPTFLSGRELSPRSCPDDRYFISSLYATGAFQAATPVVLELRGMCLCKFTLGPVRGTARESSNCFPPTSIPLVFTARSSGGFSSWHW